jgi:hypothetical protein
MTKTLSRATFDRTHRTLHQARPTGVRNNEVDRPIYLGGSVPRRLGTWAHCFYFSAFILALFAAVHCAGGSFELGGF